MHKPVLIPALVDFFRRAYQRQAEIRPLVDIFSDRVSERWKIETTAYSRPAELARPALPTEFNQDSGYYLCRYFLIFRGTDNPEQPFASNLYCPLLIHPAHALRRGNRIQIFPDYRTTYLNPAVRQLLRRRFDVELYSTAGKAPEDNEVIERIYAAIDHNTALKARRATNEGYGLHLGSGRQDDHFHELDTALRAQGITLQKLSCAVAEQAAELPKRSLFYNWESWIVCSNEIEPGRAVRVDLDRLQHKNNYSSLLHTALLGAPCVSKGSENRILSYIPSIFKTGPALRKRNLPSMLSRSQTAVIDRAGKRDLLLVKGPPGTGKSHTIACLIVSALLEGKSVLVATKTWGAMTKLKHLLIRNFGIDPELLIAASRQFTTEGVSEHLDKSFQNHSASGKSIEELTHDVSRLEGEILRLQDELVEAENKFEYRCNAGVKGTSFTERMLSLGRDPAEKFGDINQHLRAIDSLDNRLRRSFARLANRRFQLARASATSDDKVADHFSRFRAHLDPEPDRRTTANPDGVDLSMILQHQPLWLARVSNISQLFNDLSPTFDLVVLEDAHQIHTAEALPVLQRAKSAVVVGDEQQLVLTPEFSTTARNQLLEDAGLHNEPGLTDQVHSCLMQQLLTTVDPQDTTILSEHFRCHPDIIGFSNYHYYNNALQMMTNLPLPTNKVIAVVEVHGQYKQGENLAEAEQLLNDLAELVDAQKNVPGREAARVGIITFFPPQAELLNKQLRERFDTATLRKHEVRCGLPKDVQGDEFDTVFISCVIDADTPGALASTLDDRGALNVVSTRARHAQKVYLSCPEQQLQVPMFKEFIVHCKDPGFLRPRQTVPSHTIGDRFQNALCEALAGAGVIAIPNYMVAGQALDVVAIFDHYSLAIDLIGCDGDLRDVLPIQRHKQLIRAGLQCYLVMWSDWMTDSDGVVEKILERLQATQSPEQAASAQVIDPADEDHFQHNFGLSLSRLIEGFSRHKKPRAISLVTLTVEKYHRYRTILEQKFHPDELTHTRFEDAFVLLVQELLNHLQHTLAALEILDSLLKQEASYSQLADNFDSGDVQNARQGLIEEQQAHLHQLMKANESALHQMDLTTSRLDRLQTTRSASGSLSSARRRLSELTDNLEKYAHWSD